MAKRAFDAPIYVCKKKILWHFNIFSNKNPIQTKQKNQPQHKKKHLQQTYDGIKFFLSAGALFFLLSHSLEHVFM